MKRLISIGILGFGGCLMGCSLADIGFTPEQRDAIRPVVSSIATDNADDADWQEFGPYIVAVLAYPVLRTLRKKVLNPNNGTTEKGSQ